MLSKKDRGTRIRIIAKTYGLAKGRPFTMKEFLGFVVDGDFGLGNVTYMELVTAVARAPKNNRRWDCFEKDNSNPNRVLYSVKAR